MGAGRAIRGAKAEWPRRVDLSRSLGVDGLYAVRMADSYPLPLRSADKNVGVGAAMTAGARIVLLSAGVFCALLWVVLGWWLVLTG